MADLTQYQRCQQMHLDSPCDLSEQQSLRCTNCWLAGEDCNPVSASMQSSADQTGGIPFDNPQGEVSMPLDADDNLDADAGTAEPQSDQQATRDTSTNEQHFNLADEALRGQSPLYDYGVVSPEDLAELMDPFSPFAAPSGPPRSPQNHGEEPPTHGDKNPLPDYIDATHERHVSMQELAHDLTGIAQARHDQTLQWGRPFVGNEGLDRLQIEVSEDLLGEVEDCVIEQLNQCSRVLAEIRRLRRDQRLENGAQEILYTG